MKRDEFIEQLIDVLELEEGQNLTEETDLRTLEEFDSLSVLSIIAMADEHFGVKVSGTDAQNITTVKSLMEMIGPEHFE